MKRWFWGAATAVLIASPSLADGDRLSRGFGGGLKFEATLSAEQETHRPDSQGIGHAIVWFDKELSKVFVDLRVYNLTGSFLASHFHCNRAGANGPIVLGLQSPGPLTFDGKGLRGVLTNDDIATMADCVATVGRPISNIAALAFAMRDGLVYVNVHTDFSPPGEIRGQVLEDDGWDRRF